ncbi:MAG: GHMP kinase [Planctomycetes bacterium]|nr:GHMP kinase [Planctomycetota bacterium]
MDIIKHRAYARAGLVGNPSDGYHGKTLSLIVRDFYAEVVLYPWEEVEIVLTHFDEHRFASVKDLAADVRLHGYYGGLRLIKATIKKFVEYCEGRHELHERNFSIRYETNIPRQVGLAGSSAIIVATLRALMEFYRVETPLPVLPSLALSVETEELGISAGLQDRAIQFYEGLLFMDFDADYMKSTQEQIGLACGRYEPLDAGLLPPVYIAYKAEAGEPTEIFHNNLKARFNQGEPAVVEAMRHFAELAQAARDALVAGRPEELDSLINENFDTRRSICRLPEEQIRMVEEARAAGASAKFAGSGGAVVGVYHGDAMLARLRERMEAMGCKVILPRDR